MTTRLLPAHLTMPDVVGRLPRVALQQQLQQALGLTASRMVWIHGGPGWGKTTFAAETGARHDGGAVWLRLDESDADPAMLLVHLQQALDAATGPAEPTLPTLSREQLAAPRALLRQAFRALFATLPPRCLLALDDLQRAGGDTEVARWLDLLIDECRAGQRLIALSHRAAPDALARHRLSGALVVWPAQRLALSQEELAPWLAARGVGAATVLPWMQRHHGWPAALAAPSGDAAEAAAPHALAAFIDRQILDGLPAAVQALLGACAWLPEIDLRALPALGIQTAAPEAGAMLDALVRDGALVDRLPTLQPAARWRVHELLRERLRARVLASEPAAVVVQRIQDAAQWLLVDGQADAALACRFEAAALLDTHWPQVDRALQAVAPAWLAQRRQHSLRDAALRLPEAQRSAGTWWYLAQAQAPFSPASARASAERALDLFPVDARAERLRCLALIIASHFQAFDSTTPLAHWMALLEALGLDPEAIDVEQRAALAVGVWSALFLRDPQHPARRAWQLRVQAVPSSAVHPDTRMRAAMLLAKQAWYTGCHHDILPLTAQVEGALADPALSPYSRLVWCLLRQYDAWARADWPTGLAAGEEGLALAGDSGIHLLDQHLRLHAACFADLLGDPAAAHAALAEVARHADPARPMEAWHHNATRGWLMLRGGRFVEAEAASALAIEAADAMGPAPGAMALAVHCHALRAQGRDTEMLRDLSKLEQAATTGNRLAAVHAALLGADLALTTGQTLVAHGALGRALSMTHAQGLHAIFGAAAPCLARLAAAALEDGIEADSALALIRAQRLEPPPQAGEHWPWPVRVRTLGDFRIDIDGQPLRHDGKVPKRPLELLQALIAHGGCAPVAWLADALWPEFEADHAHDAFEVALRRLRKLLGHGEALRLHAGELMLEPRLVWVDVFRWRAQGGPGGGGGPARSGWSDEEFLPGCEAAWVHPARARLAAFRRGALTARPKPGDAGIGAPTP
jgi:hypothetical protein